MHQQVAQTQALIAEYARKRGKLYQPIPEGLADLFTVKLPVEKEPLEWPYIRDTYDDWHKKRVLDFGADIGYFVDGLADRGADVTAVESHVKALQIAASLYSTRLAVGRPYKGKAAWYNTLPLEGNYDMILLLNVYHWLVRDKGGVEKAKPFLLNLLNRTQYMWFSCPLEPLMADKKRGKLWETQPAQTEWLDNLAENIVVVEAFNGLRRNATQERTLYLLLNTNYGK